MLYSLDIAGKNEIFQDVLHEDTIEFDGFFSLAKNSFLQLGGSFWLTNGHKEWSILPSKVSFPEISLWRVHMGKRKL